MRVVLLLLLERTEWLRGGAGLGRAVAWCALPRGVEVGGQDGLRSCRDGAVNLAELSAFPWLSTFSDKRPLCFNILRVGGFALGTQLEGAPKG